MWSDLRMRNVDGEKQRGNCLLTPTPSIRIQLDLMKMELLPREGEVWGEYPDVRMATLLEDLAVFILEVLEDIIRAGRRRPVDEDLESLGSREAETAG